VRRGYLWRALMGFILPGWPHDPVRRSGRAS